MCLLRQCNRHSTEIERHGGVRRLDATRNGGHEPLRLESRHERINLSLQGIGGRLWSVHRPVLSEGLEDRLEHVEHGLLDRKSVV